MPALVLQHIPQELLTRLQQAAYLHQHSIEEEVLDCLHKSLMPIATTEELIARTQQLRQQFVCEADRLADVVRRLEQGKPCLLQEQGNTPSWLTHINAKNIQTSFLE